MKEKKIQSCSKKSWNNLISEIFFQKVAFELLLSENQTKSKTKHNQFESFGTGEYLLKN